MYRKLGTVCSNCYQSTYTIHKQKNECTYLTVQALQLDMTSKQTKTTAIPQGVHHTLSVVAGLSRKSEQAEYSLFHNRRAEDVEHHQSAVKLNKEKTPTQITGTRRAVTDYLLCSALVHHVYNFDSIRGRSHLNMCWFGTTLLCSRLCLFVIKILGSGNRQNYEVSVGGLSTNEHKQHHLTGDIVHKRTLSNFQGQVSASLCVLTSQGVDHGGYMWPSTGTETTSQINAIKQCNGSTSSITT